MRSGEVNRRSPGRGKTSTFALDEGGGTCRRRADGNRERPADQHGNCDAFAQPDHRHDERGGPRPADAQDPDIERDLRAGRRRGERRAGDPRAWRQRATVICPAGGFTGKMLDELLGAIPIPRTIVPIAGNTRISVTVFERKTGHEYRFTPNGPKLLPDEVAACLDAMQGGRLRHLRRERQRAARRALRHPGAGRRTSSPAKGARFILDSSGAGLSVTLEKATVTLVKPSIAELEALVGRRLDHEVGARQPRPISSGAAAPRSSP